MSDASRSVVLRVVGRKVSEMYETTLSTLKDEGNERMWFNTYVKLAKVSV